jgi:predicted CXXCH cytochrome family protein
MTASRRSSSGRGRAGGRRGGLGVGLLLAAATWGGCSVEEHYALLSVFFDGVPDPNQKAGVGRRTGGGLVIQSAHTAFADRRCSECHGETGRFTFSVSGFTGLDGTVCLRCHADVPSEHEHMHGPVAAKACLWCHDPHESQFEHLLKTTSPAMCLDCHQFHLDGQFQIPEHEDLERDCMDCHDPHGGIDRFFLKPPEAEASDEATGATSDDEAVPTEQREE